MEWNIFFLFLSTTNRYKCWINGVPLDKTAEYNSTDFKSVYFNRDKPSSTFPLTLSLSIENSSSCVIFSNKVSFSFIIALVCTSWIKKKQHSLSYKKSEATMTKYIWIWCSVLHVAQQFSFAELVPFLSVSMSVLYQNIIIYFFNQLQLEITFRS